MFYRKPHPSTRYRKENNIENTNYCEKLADITRRLEAIQKALQKLKNTLQELAKERTILGVIEKEKIIRETIKTTETNTIADIIEKNNNNRKSIISDITYAIIRIFKINKKDNQHIGHLMEGFTHYHLGIIPPLDNTS